MDAWARHAELTVSEGEIEAEFIKAQPDGWEDLYNNWKKAGQLHIIREDVLRRKALDQIVETAVVTELPFEISAE